ncbi:MAG: hypothetical protein ACI867_001685 [Glaciecola sp.]|jgi:hypothetical protein
MKKRQQDHDDSAGAPASVATREDLAFAVRSLADAEGLRAAAVAALARVRARGDGEAAVGMPVDQHLRWSTNLRHGSVSTISVIVDVAPELPTVMAAHADGKVNLDQMAAIAWPAARVSRELRRSLDLSLFTGGDQWWTWSPDMLEVEVTRMLEDLTPAATEAEQLERAQRQYFHTQSTLDGQGLKFWGQAWGVDAALMDQTLRSAAPAPVAAEADEDGVLIGRPTVRDGQLFAGLMNIFRAYGAGGRDKTPDVTIYAIVDETADGSGAGEILTATRGLAPRMSAAEVARLEADGARRVEVFAVNGEIVAVNGRAGHTINDPAGLSEDTNRIICTVRDRTCRAPGCDRPAEHLHHLIWQSMPGSTDDPSNRAWLCTRCHHRVVHKWKWAGTVGAVGRIRWKRGPTIACTRGRLDQRLKPPPIEQPLDHEGQPLPF